MGLFIYLNRFRDDSHPRSDYQAGCLKRPGNGPGKEVVSVAPRKIGESAITGRFMSVKAAQSPLNKRTAIVRTIKPTPKPKKK